MAASPTNSPEVARRRVVHTGRRAIPTMRRAIPTARLIFARPFGHPRALIGRQQQEDLVICARSEKRELIFRRPQRLRQGSRFRGVVRCGLAHLPQRLARLSRRLGALAHLRCSSVKNAEYLVVLILAQMQSPKIRRRPILRAEAWPHRGRPRRSAAPLGPATSRVLRRLRRRRKCTGTEETCNRRNGARPTYQYLNDAHEYPTSHLT